MKQSKKCMCKCVCVYMSKKIDIKVLKLCRKSCVEKGEKLRKHKIK